MPSEPEFDSLGARLRARRKELDLKISDVAERADLSVPYVSNLERGHGNPTVDALRKLADALEVPLAGLLGEGVHDAESNLDRLKLASLPLSLEHFSKSQEFRDAIREFADQQGEDAAAMRVQILLAMSAAPRRSSTEPTVTDWMRLLDAYRLILRH